MNREIIRRLVISFPDGQFAAQGEVERTKETLNLQAWLKAK